MDSIKKKMEKQGPVSIGVMRKFEKEHTITYAGCFGTSRSAYGSVPRAHGLGIVRRHPAAATRIASSSTPVVGP